MVSVDGKHHVYLLTSRVLRLCPTDGGAARVVRPCWVVFPDSPPPLPPASTFPPPPPSRPCPSPSPASTHYPCLSNARAKCFIHCPAWLAEVVPTRSPHPTPFLFCFVVVVLLLFVFAFCFVIWLVKNSKTKIVFIIPDISRPRQLIRWHQDETKPSHHWYKPTTDATTCWIS